MLHLAAGAVLFGVLLALDGSVAAADAVPAAETVILLQPATASPALQGSLARTRDELSAVRWATIAVDDRERMPQAVATRALELLRATALELSIESERAAPPRHR